MEMKMTQQQMYEASFLRPRNYFTLTSAEQWNIDARLGILDWDGTMTDEERQRFEAHYETK